MVGADLKKYATRQNFGLLFVAIAFIMVPSAPNSALYMSDNLLIRGLLIASCVGALYVDMLFGLCVFLLVARIFLERNSRKIQDAKSLLEVADTPKNEVILPDVAGDIAETEAKVDRRVYSPGGDELPYLPGEELGDNEFHSIDGSINQKGALAMTTEGAAAASSVFGDVHPPEFNNNA